MDERMTLAELGRHIGVHVDINLEGKTVGGVLCGPDTWVSGVVIGQGESGEYVTIKLDTPFGGSERRGLLGRALRGDDKVTITDVGRVRVRALTEVHPDGVPDEIAELVRAGKTLQAIKRYRALNGATLDEAQ